MQRGVRLAERAGIVVRDTFGWLPLAIAIGVSPGLFVAALARRESLGQVIDNRLSAAMRLELLAFAAASLVAVWIFYAGNVRRQRRRGAQEPAASLLARTNDSLLILLVLPILAALMTPTIETKAAGFTMVCCFAAGLLVCAAMMRAPARPAPLRLAAAASAASDRLARGTVIALAVAYGLIAAVFAVRHHQALGTRDYDLGIYDNILYQTLHGNPFGSVYSKGGTHLSAHFEPILLLLTPPYALWPRAEFLLVFQSFWIGLTALPVFELARHVLGRPWPAVGLALAALLHPALHGTNFYDFHTLSLVTPLLVAAIYALEAGRRRLYWVCFALLLITREDVSILLCLVGLYAILGRRAPGTGFVSIALAASYLAIAKLFVMPDSGLLMEATEDSYSFAPYFLHMLPQESEGVFGLLVTAVTNPFFTLKHALDVPKLLLLAQLLLPLFALPLLAPRGRVMMLYGLVFILLSSRGPVFTVHFQYSATVLGALFALTPLALGRIEGLPWLRWPLDGRRVATILVAGILVTSTAASWKFGGLVPNDSFRAGFVRPRFHPTAEQRELAAWVARSVAAMKPEDSVATTPETGPHVSNRSETGVFPDAWGSTWIFVNVRDMSSLARRELELLRESGAYELESEHGEYQLLRRREAVPLPARAERPEPTPARPGESR